ncbi:hypothetical protein LG58_2178 [Kosakonia radicincitans YD4]|nr:hypothetical protein LG58_2178 [Kosakonia radicincitans YD4]
MQGISRRALRAAGQLPAFFAIEGEVVLDLIGRRGADIYGDLAEMAFTFRQSNRYLPVVMGGAVIKCQRVAAMLGVVGDAGIFAAKLRSFRKTIDGDRVQMITAVGTLQIHIDVQRDGMRHIRRAAQTGRGAIAKDNAFDTVRITDRVRAISRIGDLYVINGVVLMVIRVIDASYVVIRTVTVNKDIVFARFALRHTLVAGNIIDRAEIIVIVRPVTLLVVAAGVIAHHKNIGMTG